MSYTKQTWANDDPTTPVNATRMNYIESGIAAADRAAYIVTALASSGAVSINASTGNVQAITLAANATSTTITNGTAGQRLTLSYIQDSTGSRTYAWPTTCKFAGGAAPTPSTTANYRDRVEFEFDGTNWYEISRAIAVR